MENIPTYAIVISSAVLAAVVGLFLYLVFSNSLWFKALALGAPVNPFRLLLMRLRRVDVNLILEGKIQAAEAGIHIRTADLERVHLAGGDVKLIVESKIQAEQAGIDIDVEAFGTQYLFKSEDVKKIVGAKIMADQAGIDVGIEDLKSHHLAHGDVTKVVEALIIAKKAKIPLPFDKAAAIDLAGRDILDAVQMSVTPKVIVTPMVEAVAKDGIQVMATARVTVRANLDKLVGGAGEDTVLARVGEGIVTAIGSAESHAQLLEKPDKISELVLKDNLDEGTAFNILSVDVADIDLGKNIGAAHQIERAQADTKIAQAEAEKAEQEMKVRVLEMRAKLLEAESQVPLAIADALRSGKLPVKDYFEIKNINADTEMRSSIAESSKKPETDDEEEES